MSKAYKHVCRLCLQRGLAFECGNMDKLKKEMLEVLLININFDISDYAVACNSCLEKIQENFDFKSKCITALVDAGNKPDVETSSPRDMVNREGKILLGNCQVCQLCLSSIEDTDFSYITNLGSGYPLRDMISECFPEIDFSSVCGPSICKQCLGSMAGYYRFMKDCKKVEGLWQLANYDIKTIDIIEEMLKSEELDKPIIKNEDVDNDVTNMKNEINEPFTSEIKCEELQIKEELESWDVAYSTEPAPEVEDINSHGGNGALTRRSQIRKFASEEEKLHFCPKCPYSSKWNIALNRHMLNHSGRHLDSQSSNEKVNLNSYISAKLKTDATVDCSQRNYKALRTSDLHRHRRQHRGKVISIKCPGCDRGCSGRKELKEHILRKHAKNKTTIAVNMTRYTVTNQRFQCYNCNYFTLKKNNLKHHVVIHSSVRARVCPSCKRRFGRKRNLDDHIVKEHKLNTDLLKIVTSKFHECRFCKYKTVNKPKLSTHIRRKHTKKET